MIVLFPDQTEDHAELQQESEIMGNLNGLEKEEAKC